MEGQSYYYNNKTKNICLINKDLLGLLFKNQKIKNSDKLITKSYEEIVKSKDVPFEVVNKNYYKWKVTNTDFIIITLDKSLDETLTFLKIPANNYKTTIEEVNINNKIDLDNLKQYKKLEDYDNTTNIQLFKGIIDKYFDIVTIPSSEIKNVSNTNNLYETYCILDNTILYTVRFQLNQDNTILALIVFNAKADLPKCLKDFAKENGNKIQKTFNSWNEFIVFLELLPKNLDNKSDEDLFKQLLQNLKVGGNKTVNDMTIEYDGDKILLLGNAHKNITYNEFKNISIIKWEESPYIKDTSKLKILKDKLIEWFSYEYYYSLAYFEIYKNFNFEIGLSCPSYIYLNKTHDARLFDLGIDDFGSINVCKGSLRIDYKLSDKDLIDDKKIISIYESCMTNFKYKKEYFENIGPLKISIDPFKDNTALTDANLDNAIKFVEDRIGDVKAKYKVKRRKEGNN